VCPIYEEANRGGGVYSSGPDFMSFVSLATSSAHVDCVRFIKVAGGFGGEGGERSVLDKGLSAVFEEDEVEDDNDLWTG